MGACARIAPFAARHRRLLIAIGALVALALAVAWVLLPRLAPGPPSFETAAVRRGTVVSTVTATGTLQPMDRVEVGSQVSGSLAEVKVDFNSRVRAGQVLARIDPASFRIRVVQQRAAVARAEAAGRKAARELERTRELFGRELSSRAELDAAEAASDQAKADLQQAHALLSAAEVDLEHALIRSPIDGVVISRAVETGQTVAASLQAPTLFVIARDLGRMKLEASVDEADVGSVRPGQRATFTIDAYPERRFTATVAQVRLQPVTSSGVVSYTTILHTENADLALLPGMTADVTIELGRRENVLTVANAALRFRPALPAGLAAPAGVPVGEVVALPAATGAAATDTVFVLGDGPPRAVAVRTGLRDGEITEIVAGNLGLGDALITGQRSDGAAPAAPSGGLTSLFRPPMPRRTR